MNCADIEILICDYVDGTLAPAQRQEVDRHLAGCPACAEMARDAAAAVAFMERAADVEPPQELISHLLFDPPWQKRRTSWFSKVFHGVLQPRFAMSMALTILSFAMVWRIPRPLQPRDLAPSKVWAGVEDRAYMLWARTQKFYDNLKFVYQIQTTLREWQQDQEQQSGTESNGNRKRTEERRTPAPSPQSRPAGRS